MESISKIKASMCCLVCDKRNQNIRNGQCLTLRVGSSQEHLNSRIQKHDGCWGVRLRALPVNTTVSAFGTFTTINSFSTCTLIRHYLKTMQSTEHINKSKAYELIAQHSPTLMLLLKVRDYLPFVLRDKERGNYTNQELVFGLCGNSLFLLLASFLSKVKKKN